MTHIVAVVVWFIPSWVLVTLIHEMGHAIVGILRGWRLSLLVIGPLGFKRGPANKMRPYFEKNPGLWGGAMAVLPAHESGDNLKIFAGVLLGGPVASLLAGFLMAGAWWWMDASVMWLMPAVMSAAIGAAMMLPMKNGFTYTDGKRYYRMRGSPSERAQEAALFALMCFTHFKKPMESLQAEHFEPLLTAQLPEHRFFGHHLKFCYHIMHGNAEAAQAALAVAADLKKGLPGFVVQGFVDDFGVCGGAFGS